MKVAWKVYVNMKLYSLMWGAEGKKNRCSFIMLTFLSRQEVRSRWRCLARAGSRRASPGNVRLRPLLLWAAPVTSTSKSQVSCDTTSAPPVCTCPLCFLLFTSCSSSSLPSCPPGFRELVSDGFGSGAFDSDVHSQQPHLHSHREDGDQ